MSLNNFEIGKELGKGAFGSVYIVKRKQDKKIYAMKQVKIIGLSKKERNNAFNEVRLLASLSHKNIIGYKEAFYDNNSETLNIVMEYADDGDLNSKIKEYIKNKKNFEENIIWKTLIQILEGLKYLHKNCIIHRDLKSANIFLTKKGIIKIGDLNVSKIINSMGMASTQTGTPYFASPEIWNNKPYDYKCDIWAVGCIIYEMAKLYVPFRAGSMRELYNNIIRGLYQPISLKYSHDLKKIIKKILVVNPELRPSANELLNCEIIRKKIKELNLGNNYDNDNDYKLTNNFEEENLVLINSIKMPINFNQINKKLPKKKYDEANKNYNEIMLKNNYENSKIDNNYYSHENHKYKNNNNNNNNNNHNNNNIFPKNQEEKNNNINYKLENFSHKNIIKNDKLNQNKFISDLKDNNIKSDWNTNNFISKIFRNKFLKINHISNLINNNIIIVNNDESKVNNSTMDEPNLKNNNINNIIDSNYTTNNIKKQSIINRIPYYFPKGQKKVNKVNNINEKNKLDLLNSSKNNSLKVEINPNLNIDNSKKINYNNIFQNDIKEMNNNISLNILKENDNIYYHKRLTGKRSFSSNNLKNNEDYLKNNKNNSLKINIPKNGRNIKRKIFKKYYSNSNICNNSLLLVEKKNEYISTNNENENENSQKNELDKNSYKNLPNKNKIFFIGNQRSIIADRNNFNNIIYRNKSFQSRTINSNNSNSKIKGKKNIFNTYITKNRIGSSDNITNTDDSTFNNMKRESNLKMLNELNNFPINSERFICRLKKKKIYSNNVQKLFNINTTTKNNKKDIDTNEENVIIPFGKRSNSYRINSCDNYINIKNKMFGENKIIGNIIDINNVSNICKRKNTQEKNLINQIQLKDKKSLFTRPQNDLNNIFKIKSSNSYCGLKSNNLDNNNNKNMNHLYELKLDLLDFNDNKNNNKNIIKNQYERNYSNYKNKIPNNKYTNKHNNLHKIFYNKIKMNNITERDYYTKYPEIINKNENYYYNKQYKSLIRNNNELSKQFSELNINNCISKNRFRMTQE